MADPGLLLEQFLLLQQVKRNFWTNNANLTEDLRQDIWSHTSAIALSSNSPRSTLEQKLESISGRVASEVLYGFVFMDNLLSDEEVTAILFGSIELFLQNMGVPPTWCSNPRLYVILRKMNRLMTFNIILEKQITDLWLPCPKRTVQRWFTDKEDVKFFMELQERYLDEKLTTNLRRRHFSYAALENSNLQILESLGAGGNGEVYRVQDRNTGRYYACKSITRPKMYKTHHDVMVNFKREISGMRRVRHHHCVGLIGSCTDYDSVYILSSPVADMNLATFLEKDLNTVQLETLSKAIGCITSALAYLHELEIRHGDLKPNNILVHDSNILLTDFGVCLDSSETSVTTTTGPPSHHTKRYSAPEVYEYAPRNRLSDIWSLGCVLCEIVSRLHGQKPRTIKSFWLSNGTRYDSYAENPDATISWFKYLTELSTGSESGNHFERVWLFSFIQHVLLEPDRLMRPTAKRILMRLVDVDQDRKLSNTGQCVGQCCKGMEVQGLVSPLFSRVARWSLPDVFGADSKLAYIFLDTKLNTLAYSGILGSHDNSNFLVGKDSFTRNLQEEVEDMLKQTTFIPGRDLNPEAQITFAQFAKSLYICCRNQNVYRMRTVPLTTGPNHTLRIRSVQIMIATLQLERQTLAGAPFVSLVFDPTDDEIISFPPANVVEMTE